MRAVTPSGEPTIRASMRRLVLALMLVAVMLVTVRARAAEHRGRCEPDGKMRIAVELRPPTGESLAGVKVNLGYPAGVALPGFMDRGEVRARLSGTPDGFLVSPNNDDGTLIVAIAGTSALPSGKIFAVEFDRCKKAAKATLKDVHCKIEQASTEAGVLVEGATCSVTALAEATTAINGTAKSKAQRPKSKEGAL